MPDRIPFRRQVQEMRAGLELLLRAPDRPRKSMRPARLCQGRREAGEDSARTWAEQPLDLAT